MVTGASLKRRKLRRKLSAPADHQSMISGHRVPNMGARRAFASAASLLARAPDAHAGNTKLPCNLRWLAARLDCLTDGIAIHRARATGIFLPPQFRISLHPCDAFRLPLAADIGLERGERRQHSEKCTARASARIDALLRHLERRTPALDFVRDVSQIAKRPTEPIEPASVYLALKT
jgi:hypothetical protein